MNKSMILTDEDIGILESYESDDGTAYFYKMLEYLDNVIEDKVQELGLTEDQIKEDLELSLRYSYALINLDSYICYYQAVDFMKHAENNAKGSAVWYYRYSVAHTYLGKLKEALYYAEKGASEDPSYPWVWLQVAKLRSHFNDKAGAINAVQKGLELVPGDYEFLTLLTEIKERRSLEEMEYHWINPDNDKVLQDGLDPSSEEKLQAISCIREDKQGLKRFEEIFSLQLEDAKEDGPALCFEIDDELSIYFVMNKAGLSHLNENWLKHEKKILSDPSLREKIFGEEEEKAKLTLIQIFLDCRTKLIYYNEDNDTTYSFWLNENGTIEANKKNNDGINVIYYTQNEMEEVSNHIETSFGHSENIFHELISEDIHVDICIIPPTEEKNYYSLVTMGMGALPMNVPQELSEFKLERAELAIALPPYWKLDSKSMEDENWYWPIRLLKTIAHIPIDNGTWIGFGHTFSNYSEFADNTKLSGLILINAIVENGNEILKLSNGKEINFYQIIPLYEGEVAFKNENGAEPLLHMLMQNTSFVVDIAREDLTEKLNNIDEVMDDASWHLESIREKNLAVDEDSAYNLMTIFLRWAICGDLMSQSFLEEHQQFISRYSTNPNLKNLRTFFKEELEGVLHTSYFNYKAQSFIRYYYLDGESPHYASDIDEHALEYFGEDRYFSDEFKDEAYLFIPFDENYYFDMAEVIQHTWEDWLNIVISDENPDALANDIIEQLDVETRFFPSMSDDDPIYTAYQYAKRIGRREGYVPILINADEESLKNITIKKMDVDELGYDENLFNTLIEKETKEINLSEEELVDNRLNSYWNQDTGMTYPLILARIPVDKPYKVFSYLHPSMHEDPQDTALLINAARYLYEKIGAYPAVISDSKIEFHLNSHRTEEDLVLVHKVLEILNKQNIL